LQQIYAMAVNGCPPHLFSVISAPQENTLAGDPVHVTCICYTNSSRNVNDINSQAKQDQ